MKLTQDELSEIVENDLPGYSLDSNKPEERSSVDAYSRSYVEAEAHTPDLETLHDKYSRSSSTAASSMDSVAEESAADYASLRDRYLGSDVGVIEGSVADAMETADAADYGSSEDTIVSVTPRNSAHPLDRGARPKAAVISGSEKRVIGQQG